MFAYMRKICSRTVIAIAFLLMGLVYAGQMARAETGFSFFCKFEFDDKAVYPTLVLYVASKKGWIEFADGVSSAGLWQEFGTVTTFASLRNDGTGYMLAFDTDDTGNKSASQSLMASVLTMNPDNKPGGKPNVHNGVCSFNPLK